mmetsp:Transcript_22163/g.43665  ORF Transcript_22163/g.43665 Transcript_22163/m.43665 type:complete len:237 (+) Transcript_22163:219-929(+)
MTESSADDDVLKTALMEVWEKIGLEKQSNKCPIQVPYHGAEAVQTAVKAVIAVTPTGNNRPMSASIMMRLLVDHGLPEPMAMKLPSQIRKGAPMHDEWKDAFKTGRFVQKLGRSMSTNVSETDANLKKARTNPLQPSLAPSTKYSQNQGPPFYPGGLYSGGAFGGGSSAASQWGPQHPPYRSRPEYADDHNGYPPAPHLYATAPQRQPLQQHPFHQQQQQQQQKHLSWRHRWAWSL